LGLFEEPKQVHLFRTSATRFEGKRRFDVAIRPGGSQNKNVGCGHIERRRREDRMLVSSKSTSK
jgi:hypothetical protein